MDSITRLTPGTQVTGWIKFFHVEKGFGFVSVEVDGSYVDVFIRKERGHEMTGTHDAHAFGELFDYSAYRFKRFRPYEDHYITPTEIVMVVEPDNRGGWRATRWGVRPEFTWIDLYLNRSDLMQRYVGGLVEFYNSSDFGVGGYHARVDGLELTREHLTTRVRLYPFSWQPGDRKPAESEMRHVTERSYSLAPVTQKKIGSMLELSWREDGSYNRLTFSPASC